MTFVTCKAARRAKEAFWLLCIWPVVILLSAFAPGWGEVLGPYDD